MGLSGGLNAGNSKDSYKSSFTSDTTIEIKYYGSKKNAFIKSVSIDDLTSAVLGFPE